MFLVGKNNPMNKAKKKFNCLDLQPLKDAKKMNPAFQIFPLVEFEDLRDSLDNPDQVMFAQSKMAKQEVELFYLPIQSRYQTSCMDETKIATEESA